MDYRQFCIPVNSNQLMTTRNLSILVPAFFVNLFLTLAAAAQYSAPRLPAAQPEIPGPTAIQPAPTIPQPTPPSPQPGVVDKSKVMDFFQNQQFEEAIAYLRPAIQADSNNQAVLGWMGYAFYMNDNPQQAKNYYLRVLDADSNNITALHYMVLLLNDDPKDAIGYASRLLKLQPARAVWWRGMGELSVRGEQWDSALYYFNQAYTMAPSDTRTIAGLADVLVEARDFARADSIVDVALAGDSLNGTLLRLKVRVAYQGHRYAEVLAPGERIVESNDPAVQALTWLSLAYYDLKRYPECIHVCEHMLDLDISIESVYYYDARAWTKMKNYLRADSLLRLALKKAISGTAEWYFDDLGDNEESLHHYKASVANYDTAYYLFRDPRVLYTCGRICEVDMKDMAMARKYYRRYLAVAKPVSKDEMEAYRYVKKVWGKKE
jgi:tetratricopeptide (TPR) repeat protein